MDHKSLLINPYQKRDPRHKLAASSLIGCKRTDNEPVSNWWLALGPLHPIASRLPEPQTKPHTLNSSELPKRNRLPYNVVPAGESFPLKTHECTVAALHAQSNGKTTWS